MRYTCVASRTGRTSRRPHPAPSFPEPRGSRLRGGFGVLVCETGADYTRSLPSLLRGAIERTPAEAASVLHVLGERELFLLLTDVVETGKIIQANRFQHVALVLESNHFQRTIMSR